MPSEQHHAASSQRVGRAGVARREFIKAAFAVPLGLVAGSVGAPARAQGAPRQKQTLPQIPFGPYSISRLVLGGNPQHGNSHMSFMINHAMREYFTPERVQWLLRHAEEQGINVWQSSKAAIDDYKKYRDAGGKMYYIALEKDAAEIAGLVAKGAIAIAHHGEVTDRLFKAGNIDQVQDFLKRVRDAGVLVGVSTHIPQVIEYIEEKGWDVDFYMACVYQRHRTREELRKMLGEAPIPIGEVYLERDPERMCRVIRQTRRTCLAFKILAAGRLCNRKADVDEAFRFVFANIKATDGVIVGMYPRYSDQVAENCALVRKYSHLSKPV